MAHKHERTQGTVRKALMRLPTHGTNRALKDWGSKGLMSWALEGHTSANRNEVVV